MRRIKKIGITFGFIFLSSVFCLTIYVTGGQEAEAGVLDYDFTYATSDDTIKVGNLGDTTIFGSVLTNTGTDADSYMISLTENHPPTPIEWLIWLCYGVCGDTTLTDTTVYLDAGEWDAIFVEMCPRDTAGEASVTVTVTSIGNPALSDSLTFHLIVREEVPVTDQWGLLILISLLFVAGLYLILKRLRPVRITPPS